MNRDLTIIGYLLVALSLGSLVLTFVGDCDLNTRLKTLEVRQSQAEERDAELDENKAGVSWVVPSIEQVHDDIARLRKQIDSLSAKIPPTYIDESEIPPLLRDVEMGEAYPHIVIDGEKLDYHADKGHYCYAGSNDRAMWLGFGKDRQLGIPDKIDPHTGKRLVRRNGKWIEEELPAQGK